MLVLAMESTSRVALDALVLGGPTRLNYQICNDCKFASRLGSS